MSCIGDHPELGIGQALVNFPRSARWCANVVTALDDYGGDVGNLICVVQQLRFLEIEIIDEEGLEKRSSM